LQITVGVIVNVNVHNFDDFLLLSEDLGSIVKKCSVFLQLERSNADTFLISVQPHNDQLAKTVDHVGVQVVAIRRILLPCVDQLIKEHSIV
jgi:hypothetical protein